MTETLIKVMSASTGRPMVRAFDKARLSTFALRGLSLDIACRWYGRHVATQGADGLWYDYQGKLVDAPHWDEVAP